MFYSIAPIGCFGVCIRDRKKVLTNGFLCAIVFAPDAEKMLRGRTAALLETGGLTRRRRCGNILPRLGANRPAERWNN